MTKQEKVECREVVVALLAEKYEGDKTVGDYVISPKKPIRDSEGHCIGYAVYTLNDLCNRNPADEWMEMVVRVIHKELFITHNYNLVHLLCRDFEMLTMGYYTEYYKDSIISDILHCYKSLVEIKKYSTGDIGYSLHRMSDGEYQIMSRLNSVCSDSFTKEVYNIMCRIRDIYSQNPNGTMDYFLGFSMSESEFINFTKSRFVYNRIIREV